MEAFSLILLGAVIVLLYVVFLMYIKFTRAVYIDQPDMTNKTVIITGATSGIGYETALGLAARNARVILACRNEQKATICCEKITMETGNKNIIYKHLDLCSFKSIRKFVSEIKAEESQVHVLINNAGILAHDFKKTEDGLETNFATNYFGPFLLTNLLLDKLKKSDSSRIVNVTSVAYQMGYIDLSNLNCEDFGFVYRMRVYGCTKLATVLFTRELSRRLHNTGVTVNCLEPGSVLSPLYKKVPFVIWLPLITVAYLFFRNCEEGAQTSLFCAMSKDLNGVSGKFFSDCKMLKLSGKASDDELARKLWQKSVEITKLNN